MNRLIQIRLFAIVIAVAACASSLLGAETQREQPYVVTLEASAAVDGVQTIGAQLAATYGGTLAKDAGAPQDAFVLRISAEKARVLARDPRVVSVTSSRLHPMIENATEVVNWTSGVPYSYDGSGNISQIGTDKFLYDDAGRLVQATMNSVQRNYEYDGFGNRKKCTQSGVECQNGFTINTNENKNRIDQASYDAAGNVTGLPSLRHTYTYDAFNMMTRDDYAPMAREFVYTADDERIGVYNVGATWRWTLRDTSGKVLRELTSGDAAGTTWQWAKDFVWRDGLLLASRQAEPSATTTYHYHLDHLGTPRRITDQNDRIIGVHDYFAFGQEISVGTQEPLPAALKYTGHERDTWAEGGFDTLDYMHARYYSPVAGRFLSVDPVLNVKRALRQPQNWNRYSYVMNNPLRYTDPDGRDHYQEPEFTKPMTAANLAMDENTPAVIKGAFYAEGALLSAAAAVVAYDALNVAALHAMVRIATWGGGGAATAEGLRRAAASGGPTTTVITNLTRAPQEGRTLYAAAGEGAQLAANAARSGPGVTTYAAQIPQALMKGLQGAGLVEVSQLVQKGSSVVVTQYKFLPGATEYVLQFFKAVPQ